MLHKIHSCKVYCVTSPQIQFRVWRHDRVCVVVPPTQKQRCLCHTSWLNTHSENLYKAAVIFLNSQVGVFLSITNNNKLPTQTTYNCFLKSPLLQWEQILHPWTNYTSSQTVCESSNECLFFIFLHNPSGSVSFFSTTMHNTFDRAQLRKQNLNLMKHIIIVCIPQMWLHLTC